MKEKNLTETVAFLRETPETDAAFINELDVELVAAGSGRWKGDTKMELVPADFARKLERERDAAREAIRAALAQVKLDNVVEAAK